MSSPEQAKEMRLRKHEQVTITGSLVQKQEVALISGENQTIYHVLVTHLEVPQRLQESIPQVSPTLLT